MQKVTSNSFNEMPEEPNSFKKAADKKPPSLWREIAEMLRENKKWWLVPIIAALLLAGALVVLSASSPVVQFIYTLF